jgi:hypothetical protein
MTSPSPDPDPANTPGLEPGGGVAPGDTPPGESSTSGAAFQEPDLPSRRTNWVVYAIVGSVVGVALLLFVGYVVGLLD